MRYNAYGKLLLSGEYLALDGALAFALPTRFGQQLSVFPIDEKRVDWQAFDSFEQPWIRAGFSLDDGFNPLQIEKGTPDQIHGIRLILKTLRDIQPECLNQGYRFITQLDFNSAWGLGSSATLLYNLALWASVDPYLLLDRTFGGSGYDIAVSQYKSAILYKRDKFKSPSIEPISWKPPFAKSLYFVYLNRKQNTQNAVSAYLKSDIKAKQLLVDEISHISRAMSQEKDLESFEELMQNHEAIISSAFKMPKVKEIYFSDYRGAVKSLGAWGGDFVMVTQVPNMFDYFKKKGFAQIIPYKDMILHSL